MRRRTASLVLLSAGAISVVGLAPVSASTHALTTHVVSADHGRFLPAVKGEVLPTHNGTASSLNWSGYATAPGSGVTGVTSTFTVPAVNVLPPGFAANWAGIGGYTSSDLIQAGTSEDELQGDYAWYEILPDSETPLTDCTGDPACTVNPGDVVTVDIHNVGTNLWSVSLRDGTRWTWQQDIPYVSSESSAEWIFEAPTVGVQTIPANTGTNYFGPTSTYTDASGSHPIAAGNPVSIDMGIGIGVNEATPSALASDGQSFNVCAYQQSCPTPAS
ncbi:MAG TPA: G1 family glutamic endopeptidase [Mycobacteriales bacterium]|nr:G1 family glutamic endopeptidase [Mycobacteriales bacterium]